MAGEDGIEDWLVRDVLGVFGGVKILILSDKFHHNFEKDEELVWLKGELCGSITTSSGGHENGPESIEKGQIWVTFCSG